MEGDRGKNENPNTKISNFLKELSPKIGRLTFLKLSTPFRKRKEEWTFLIDSNVLPFLCGTTSQLLGRNGSLFCCTTRPNTVVWAVRKTMQKAIAFPQISTLHIVAIQGCEDVVWSLLSLRYSCWVSSWREKKAKMGRTGRYKELGYLKLIKMEWVIEELEMAEMISPKLGSFGWVAMNLKKWLRKDN